MLNFPASDPLKAGPTAEDTVEARPDFEQTGNLVTSEQEIEISAAHSSSSIQTFRTVPVALSERAARKTTAPRIFERCNSPG